MSEKKVDENYNTVLMRSYAIRPVAMNPWLAKISGKASSGLFISQLLYWWGKGKKKDWIYKSIREMKEETCLTRAEQETAIKTWKALGILEVKVAGIPPTNHYKIDIRKVSEMLAEFTNHYDQEIE